MSYFRFYIYKAIRKVLFLPFLIERAYKCLIFGSNETSIQEIVFLPQVTRTALSE